MKKWAICKSRNGESGNGMRVMMGTQGISVGMRGMRGIRAGMWGMGVEMRRWGLECEEWRWECGYSFFFVNFSNVS